MGNPVKEKFFEYGQFGPQTLVEASEFLDSFDGYKLMKETEIPLRVVDIPQYGYVGGVDKGEDFGPWAELHKRINPRFDECVIEPDLPKWFEVAWPEIERRVRRIMKEYDTK